MPLITAFAMDPPVSEAQRKAMFAAASGHSTLGIPKKVGEEFVGKAHDEDEDDLASFSCDEWSDEAREAAIRARQGKGSSSKETEKTKTTSAELKKKLEGMSHEKLKAALKNQNVDDAIKRHIEKELDSRANRGTIKGFGEDEDDLKTKAEADYEPTAKANDHCGRCEHFLEPKSCEIVEGKISPEGWCKFFEAERGYDEWSEEARAAALEARRAHGGHGPSKEWHEAIHNKQLKSHEVAAANAKELYKLRKKIDEAKKGNNHEKAMHLEKLYEHVQKTGNERHESMEVHSTKNFVKSQDEFAADQQSVRQYDADGRMHVEKTPISKANVCEYWGREIPDAETLGLDPDHKYKLLRHPDELRKAADTFNAIPLLRRHIPVSADDHRPDDVIGATGTDAVFEHPYLMNSLVVWAKDDIDQIEMALKKELSSAYRYRADMTSGTYEGQAYDGIMRDLGGNHVAIVEAGRAGPDVCVGDSMENLNMDKSVSPKRKALDALAAFVTPKLATDGKLSEEFNKLLLALDEAEPEKEKEEVKTDKKAKDSEKEEHPIAEKIGDKKARDRKARDEFKESLKDKMKAEDYKTACDEIDAMDWEDDEDDKKAKDKKAKDEEDDEKEKEEKKAEDKKAMDTQIKLAMDQAMIAERQRQRDVREAERFVRPWIGDLKIAYDTAEDVYKAALEATGKATKGIHPSAYRSILEDRPKPGTGNGSTPRVAMDAAGTKSYHDRFPDASRIGHA